MTKKSLKFVLLVSFLLLGFMSYAHQKPLDINCEQAFLDLNKVVKGLVLVAQSGEIKQFENLKDKVKTKDIDTAFIFLAQNQQIQALESLKHLASSQALYTAYGSAIKHQHQKVILSLKSLVSQALVKRSIRLATKEELIDSVFVYIYKIDSTKYDLITVFVESALFEGASFLEFIFANGLVSSKDIRDIFSGLALLGEAELLKTIINKKNSHIKMRGDYLHNLVKALLSNSFNNTSYWQLLDLVKILINKGIYQKDKDIALELVNKTRHEVLEQILIDSGANKPIDKIEKEDESYFDDNKDYFAHEAMFIKLAKKGQIASLEKKFSNTVFITQATKEKALLEAIKNRQNRVVELLSHLIRGRSTTYKPIIYKALHLAISIRYVEVYEILTLLIGYDYKSLTAKARLLVLATQKRDKELIKVLIKKDLRPPAIYQAIFIASEQGYSEELKLLVKGLKNSVNNKSSKDKAMIFFDKNSIKILKQARLKAQENKHYNVLNFLDPYIEKLILSGSGK